jgi:predicted nucleic-acid-binding protein
MRAVDTNVLVRLMTVDDPAQTATAEKFIAGGVWVPLVALAEAIWRIRKTYEFSNSETARAIEMILNHPNVVLQDSETVASALELFRAKPNLGFFDCLILETARRAGHLPLGTFDKALARNEGAQKL